LLDVKVETVACPPSTDDKDVLVIDLDAFRSLVFPFPNNAWQQVTDCNATITPMCRTLQNMVRNDLKNVVRVLSDLEPTWDSETLEEADDDDSCPMNIGSGRAEPGPYLRGGPPSHRIRRHSLSTDGTPPRVPCVDLSVPTIIVTPCSPQEPETSCHVPLQNCAFGNRLTVPRHPAFNQTFPPLTVSTPSTLSSGKKWRWQNGHWHAALPSLEEQAAKGLFSRALDIRRSRRTRRS